MKAVVLLVCGLVSVAVVHAQLGFFDLDAHEDTKFKGTTGTVLPKCMSIPTGICGDGGRTIYTNDGHPTNLLSYYTFDDSHGLDHSGNANHALSPPPNVGPGREGKGQSAYFGGGDFFKIPHSPAYEGLRQMTVSFWMYLLTDSIDAWRVVFRKGEAEKDLTPTLLLSPDSRKLHARLSTSNPAKNGIDSVTAIPLRRWTHVALTVNYNVLSLYVNGVLDNEGMVTGEVELNRGAWFIGKDLHLPGTGMFLDNLKIHSHALDQQALQVEASSALPGLGPNFLRLGCTSCIMKTAIERCASTGGYHLCREMELNGGGLAVARAMGYLEMSSEHWTAEDGEQPVELEKLALCCLD